MPTVMTAHHLHLGQSHTHIHYTLSTLFLPKHPHVASNTGSKRRNDAGGRLN